MLSSVATLMKRAETANSPEGRVFQQHFLLVGIHLFKVSSSAGGRGGLFGDSGEIICVCCFSRLRMILWS